MKDDNALLSFYQHCDYCQSWPTCYTCSHPNTFVRDLSGKPIQARECFYTYMGGWDKRWLAHPCPFFSGRISIEHDDGSNTELVIHKEGELICYPDG